MVHGCGNKTIKFLVFTFNFLVFAVGIAVLALSLTTALSTKVRDEFQKILNQSQASSIDLNQMYIALYILAAVGALLILMGFLGCCGAWCENRCLLGLFFTILLILFLAELGCGIAVLVTQPNIRDSLFKAVSDQMKNWNTLTNDEKDAINEMQKNFACCGCHGVADYGSTIPAGVSCPAGSAGPGCCDKIWHDVQSNLAIVGGVSIGILVIELLAMIFTCVLCRASHGDHHYA